MSEDRAQYITSSTALLLTLENSPALKGINDPGYIPPTAEEIKAVTSLTGLTQAQAGEALGVSARTYRSWLDDGDNGRPIPYTAWRLLLIKTGVVNEEVFTSCTNATLKRKQNEAAKC